MARFSLIFFMVAATLVKMIWGIFTDDEKAAVKSDYDSVRNKDLLWCTVIYEGKEMVKGPSGTDYEGFKELLQEDNRVYGYLRFSMNGSDKYVFLTWIGPGVSPLKKAKVSTDKTFVKQIFQQYSREVLADEMTQVTNLINTETAGEKRFLLENRRNLLLAILEYLQSKED